MSGPIDPRTPCLIGAAQRTWHPSPARLAPEPLAMQTLMVREAAEDAGATGGGGAVLAAAESLSVVNCMSWPYDDPAGRLAEALAITPGHRHYSAMSGTTPQALVNVASRRMRVGDLGVAVIVGAEALHTKRTLKQAGERPAWSFRSSEPPALDPSISFLPSELTHEVFQAWLTFAVRDIARRAASGESPEAHRRSIGELMAPMTTVAAANPHAWFRRERTVDDLVVPTPDNRMVGYPYTKNTVAIMDVDMAAAVIVATHEAADRLGVPAERRVYLRGFAEADDATYLAQHPDLARSPGMASAFAAALSGAGGVDVEEIAHFDLYSCFASSVHFALDALGLTAEGLASSGRSVTVTGGLPFAGGPASNYVSHSLASMVERLRAEPGSSGLVSGVGMHMTKHAAAVYSTTPGDLSEPAPAPPPEVIAVVDTYSGQATIAAYSVVHGRDGEAVSALVVADTADGSRCYGRTDDADTFTAMEADEWVGRAITLRSGDDGVNRIV